MPYVCTQVKQYEKKLKCTPEFITQTAITLHQAYQSRNVGDADRGWKKLDKVRCHVGH